MRLEVMLIANSSLIVQRGFTLERFLQVNCDDQLQSCLIELHDWVICADGITDADKDL